MDVASLQVIIKTKGVEAAQRELDKLTKSSGNAEKSVGGLASSMQTLANIAIVGYLAKATKSAIELNAQFESMQIGIATLISVNAKNTTSLGKTVTSYEKFTMAQMEAAEAVEMLRKANAETPATLKELTEGFQAAIGPALKYGMTISQTINYAKLMTQAAASMGMPMQQLAQEMRAILTGNIDMNAAVARNLGITNEQITLHKKQGDMYEFLISKLQDFEAAGKSMANSWAGITSNIEDTMDSMRKNASSGLFNVLKEDIKELNSYFISNASKIEKEVSSWLDTFYSLGVVMSSSSKNMVVLYQDVDRLSTVLGQNAKEDGNLGLFKNSILGLNVLLDSMYVGLHNSIELASRLAVSSKNAFEFLSSGELAKAKNAFDDMLNPKGIISAEELLNRQIDMYKKLLNVKTEFSKESKKEEVANPKGALVFGATAEKTEEELRKIKKLSEDWAKRKIEIDTNMAIAEQDELAKPFILLEAEYKKDIEYFKNNKEAKERLTEEFNAKYQRLAKDETKKSDEDIAKSKQKDIQKELKLQEENFRIQARQVELLDDEADKQVALATLEYQRTQASLKAQVLLGEKSPEYYNAMMEMEDKLLEKQKQNWTLAGQVVNNVTSQMESSMTDFLDATSDNFADFGKMATSILQEVYREIIRIAVVKPLVSSLTSGAMSLFSGGASVSAPTASTYDINTGGSFTNAYFQPNAKGGAYSSPSLSQYSNQIVDKPTFFAFASGGAHNMGVMGEAGSEAILPLSRTSNGDLGVKAEGMGLNQVKIQIINESGTQMEVTKTTQTTDVEGMVIQAWISGISKNRMGSRDMLSGGR